MTPRFALVPAAYVFLIRSGPSGDEVLLQLRQNTGFMDDHWAAGAAGHLEPGETASVAALREAHEELGLDGVDLRFELTMQRTQNLPGEPRDPKEDRVDFFFTARSWTGEPHIMEPAKCADLRWWPLSNLPDPVVPHELHALTHLGGDVRYLTFGL